MKLQKRKCDPTEILPSHIDEGLSREARERLCDECGGTGTWPHLPAEPRQYHTRKCSQGESTEDRRQRIAREIEERIVATMEHTVAALLRSYPDLTRAESRIARQASEITARRLLGREVTS